MQTERIVNLFVYIEGDRLCSFGAVVHLGQGSDDEKIAFLRDRVAVDAGQATHYPIPTASFNVWLGVDTKGDVTFDMFSYLCRIGKALLVFEHVLRSVDVSQQPLVCITPVKDGKPMANILSHLDPVSTGGTMLVDEFGAQVAKIDYLSRYVESGRLNLHDLLGDDFLAAIKLLHEHKLYVSATKLLVSFVDTMAYIEYGDKNGNCEEWLSAFAVLDDVGITPAEFWEFRNGLLHMTNPFSRRVASGKVASLRIYSDVLDRSVKRDEAGNAIMFSFEALYDAIMQAIDRWAVTYNGNLPKQLEFIERYDVVHSEGRLGKMFLSSE
ncbi:MAG: hypothetical protein ACOYOU_03170 [Kiritimatiellia bacterium]